MNSLRPDSLVEFGPPARPMRGRIHEITGTSASIVVDDFLGRRTLWSLDIDALRPVPVELRRRA